MASVSLSKSPVKKVRFALDGEMGERAASKAQKTLQKIANKAGISLANEQANVTAWNISMRNVLPSAGTLMCLAKPLTEPFTKSAEWLYSFGPAARLVRQTERTEREWREAVRKAEETQAQRHFMDDLSSARLRFDEESKTVVTSALGHRSSRPTSQTEAQAGGPEDDDIHSLSDDYTQTFGVGSIFSNTPVPPPPAPKAPSSDASVPGFHLRKPTVTFATNTYQPHAPSRDSTSHQFLDQDPRGDFQSGIGLSNNTTATSLRVPTAAPRSDITSHTNATEAELATSASDSDGAATTSSSFNSSPTSTLGNSRTTSRTSVSVAATVDSVDRFMKGDADGMIMFGRWRHHKDAPLSFVREMIEKDISGPGSQSLYGCGILKIEDHPLVPLYNARLKKAQLDGSYDAKSMPPLSPILVGGNSTASRLAMRTSTSISCSMTGDSIFRTAGFAQRTRSMCSVSSSNDSISSEKDTTASPDNSNKQKSLLSALAKSAHTSDETQKPRSKILATQDIYPPPNPDPAMNWRELMASGDSNHYLSPRYIRRPEPYISEQYIAEHCKPKPHPAAVTASGPGTPQVPKQRTPPAMSRDATRRPQHQHQRQTSSARPAPLPMSRDKTRRPQLPFRPRNQQQQAKPANFHAPLKKPRKLDIVAAEDAEDAIASDSESESDDESQKLVFEKIVVPGRAILGF